MEITEKIPSRLDSLANFVPELLQKIRPFLTSEDDFFDIRLCLEEALINAIKHGNKLDEKLSVEIDVQATPGKIQIIIKNQGQGFDFRSLPDPTKTENLHKTSGRGVYLIRKTMDQVEYFDCGRGLKMVKLIK